MKEGLKIITQEINQCKIINEKLNGNKYLVNVEAVF